MTEFIFSNPFFLWMLPAAALPVIFHLFFRIRRRTRPFSTLMFFRRAAPRLSARRQLREWLALLLRILAILLLLLALARPVWLGTGATGQLTAVVVIDNSGSMSTVVRAGRTKLDQALDAAAAILADLGRNDRAALVLLVGDPAVALPAGLTSDRTALQTALGRIGTTEATGAPARAVERAFALLRSASTARKEVHLITDLQAEEWGRNAIDTAAPPYGTLVYVHRIASPLMDAANVAVDGIRAPHQRLIAGRPFLGEVALQNTSEYPAKLRLNTLDSENNRSTTTHTLPPRESQVVRFVAEPQSPGFHWIRAWVEDSAFPADNEAYFGYVCGARERVLFAGDRRSYGLLPLALSPSGSADLSGIEPVFATPAEIDARIKETKPVMVAMTWPQYLASLKPGSGAASLAKYVNDGGNLLIVPPCDDVQTPLSGTPAWAGAAAHAPAKSDAGEAVVIFDKGAAVWSDIRDEHGEFVLGNLRAFRYCTLSLATNAVPLLGLENGSVLLAQTTVGKGSVFASGLAFDTQWSNLPLKPACLALLQGIALQAPASAAGAAVMVAGDAAPSPVPSGKTPAPVQVTTIAGDAVSWTGPAEDRPAIPRAGVYRCQSGTYSQYIAVRCDEHEGNSTFLDGRHIPALARLTYRYYPYTDAAELVRILQRTRTGSDLFLPLHLLALLCILFEGWVVNPRPRPHAVSAQAAPLWRPLVSAIRGLTTRKRS